MARGGIVSNSMLWAANVLQFSFFIVLSAMYLWRYPGFNDKLATDQPHVILTRDLHASEVTLHSFVTNAIDKLEMSFSFFKCFSMIMSIMFKQMRQ